MDKPAPLPLCGIYAATCMPTGKQYIGRSIDIQRRWNDHLKLLRANKHHSPHFQYEWNKYGEKAFQWTVLEQCSLDRLTEREQHWIDTLAPQLNVAFQVDKPFDFTPEIRQRMAEAARRRLQRDGHPHVGKKFSAEYRHKLAIAHLGQVPSNKGVPISAATRQRVSEAVRAHHSSEEYRARVSAWQTGRKQSVKTRQKRSESLKQAYAEGRRISFNLGKPAWNKGKTWGPETREKLRQIGLERAARGEISTAQLMTSEARLKAYETSRANGTLARHTMPHSEETKRRIADKKRGHVQSAETRAKRSESLKRAYAEGRRKRQSQ